MKTTMDPIRPTDDAARHLARGLILGARIAALGTLAPDTGHPQVTRIGFGIVPDGSGLTLVSGLSAHADALRRDPRCSLLLGEPADRGDPLNSARITLRAMALPVPPQDGARDQLRAIWLADHPKARLYVDFADFFFVRFHWIEGSLNGGFGKAFALTASDLALAPHRNAQG